MNKNIKNNFKILAIESSCDETSAAVLAVSHQSSVISIKIISNIISSQIKLHSKYGGVYPELASREHVKNIIPVITQALTSDIDYIAVTSGPGLIGSLLVGVNTAKTLAYANKKPLIAVNHLEGHIYANFINSHCEPQRGEAILNNTSSDCRVARLQAPRNDTPQFPLIALIVSGGHTSLVYMKNHLDYKIIGETYDDAAGEAYDKVASMLGLPYPGGPEIDKIAQSSKLKTQSLKLFPRPLINEDNFDFSFSGLKTSVLYYLKKQNFHISRHSGTIKHKTKEESRFIQHVCYEFQEAATDVLVEKTFKAAKQYKAKSILIGGGVAANSRLREKLKTKNEKLKIKLFIPELKYCTDNAAVIGVAAAYKILAGHTDKWYTVNADSNLKLK